MAVRSCTVLIRRISRELFRSAGLHIKQIRWSSSSSYLQRRISRNCQLAIPCPSHLLHCLTNSNLLSITFVSQGLCHDRPSSFEQSNCGLSTIRPRSARSTRIRCYSMELVIRHELIGEESLITNNSFRDTVVLFSPLTKSSQSLGRFQTRKGRSPQEIRRTINDDQGKVSLVTKLNLTLRFWLAEALARRCYKHDSP